jgi:hypothetical protein
MGMLRLVAGSAERQTPTLPIRWCLDRDTMQKLEEAKAMNPHLLLVVIHRKLEVERRLIPLERMMDFLDFHRAGEHRIFATIVWWHGGDVRALKKSVFGGRAHGIEYDELRVQDHEGEFFLRDSSLKERHIYRLKEEAEVHIEVAAEHFAKAPSALEKWWVNLWFESPARDQCHLRRRRMLAYLVQPIPVLAYVLGLTMIRILCATWFALLLERGMSFKPIFHPWNLDTNDIWHRAKGAFFVTTKNGEWREGAPGDWTPLFLCLTPIVGVFGFAVYASIQFIRWGFFEKELPSLASLLGVGLAAGVALQAALTVLLFLLFLLARLHDLIEERGSAWEKSIAAWFTKLAPHRWKIAGIGVLAFAILCAAVGGFALAMSFLLVVGLAAGLIWFVNRFMDFLVKIKTRKAQPEEIQTRLTRQFTTYRPLLCEPLPIEANVRALPKERQTFYLWYKDIKAKVCKPFAVG